MNLAEREFWLSVRRGFLAVSKACDTWFKSGEQTGQDAKFSEAFRAGINQSVGAIDKRLEVGRHEPKEKSMI